MRIGSHQSSLKPESQETLLSMDRSSTRAQRAGVSDALVFFGATGDLAYKKIFPALQNMVRRGTLKTPVIGIAKSGWTIDQLRARAKASVTQYGGGGDGAAFPKLLEGLGYVDGADQEAGDA